MQIFKTSSELLNGTEYLNEYIIRKHVEFNLHLCITIVSMRYFIQFYSDAIFVFAYRASNLTFFLHLFFRSQATSDCTSCCNV